MISFPFDNLSEQVQDRAVSSDIFAEYLQRIVGTNGIFGEIGNKMRVTPSVGMNVIVLAGDGFIQGRLFAEITNRELIVQASESLDRIDRVVIRLDKQLRSIDFKIIKGTSATVPTAPDITRAGDVYDLAISDLFIAKNTTSITADRISDLRLNPALCGIVPIFGSVDTTNMFNQIQSTIDNFYNYVLTKTTAWDNQMVQQQTDYVQQKNEIDSWYNSVKLDISNLQKFDFDNLIYFKGYKYTASKTKNPTVWTETIKKVSDNSIYATRVSTKDASGKWTVVTTCQSLGISTSIVYSKLDGVWEGVIA